MDNKVKVAIDGLSDELKKVVRRQDEIQKSVDLLFQDRTILEDLSGSVQSLKEIIVQNQDHQDKARDSLHADVKVTGEEVKDLKSEMEDKTMIVKSSNKGLFNKLFKIFNKEVKKA